MHYVNQRIGNKIMGNRGRGGFRDLRIVYNNENQYINSILGFHTPLT